MPCNLLELEAGHVHVCDVVVVDPGVLIGKRQFPAEGAANHEQEDRSGKPGAPDASKERQDVVNSRYCLGWRHSTQKITNSILPYAATKETSIKRASDTVSEPNAMGENYVAHIRLPGFWREDRLLSFFLAFLVLMTIVVPMFDLSRPGRIAIDVTFALMLLSGAIATVKKRMLLSPIIALTSLEFTADLIVEFNRSFSPRGWDTGLKVFCMAILVVMTLKQTFLPGPVTVHRVMGGVAAYLLIGVTWAFAYKLLMEEIPDAIHFQTPLATGGPKLGDHHGAVPSHRGQPGNRRLAARGETRFGA
jgi:hypothetical protein